MGHLKPIFLAIALCLSLPAPAGLDPDFLDAAFEHTLAEEGIPGGAFAVVRNGRIVHAAGFGVRSAGGTEPIDTETVFRVASVSKTFSAQLAALLVREGRMNWADPVIDYAPGFSLKPPGQPGGITLRHIVGQSAGLVPNAYDNLLNAGQSLDRIVPRFAEIEPLCAPGECYTYQNVLFSLIGPAAEQATGQAFPALLAERFFEPLGMSSASVGLEAWQASNNRARPHVRRGPLWVPTRSNGNYYAVAPAAGINASVLDLGQWLIAQMGHRPDVLAREAILETTEPGVRTRRDLQRAGWREMLTDAHYGLGWRIYSVGDEAIYLHSGWVRGFVAEIAYSRTRDTGLVVLLNAESSVLNAFTTAFWQQVLEAPLMVEDSTGSGAGTTAAASGP